MLAFLYERPLAGRALHKTLPLDGGNGLAGSHPANAEFLRRLVLGRDDLRLHSCTQLADYRQSETGDHMHPWMSIVAHCFCLTKSLQ